MFGHQNNELLPSNSTGSYTERVNNKFLKDSSRLMKQEYSAVEEVSHGWSS